MNVLLVSLQKNFSIISLKLLHEILRREGFNSNILYIQGFPEDSKSLDSLKGYIKDFSPNWVGISLTSSEYKYAKNFTLFLKKHFDFPVIWGGVEPTVTPEHGLPYADYVCIGEGEKAVVDISNAIKNGERLETINNLAYKDGDNIHINPLNPLLESMDDLPYIPRVAKNSFFLHKGKVVELTHELVRKNSVLHASIYRIINSRGCPMRCTFLCKFFLLRFVSEISFSDCIARTHYRRNSTRNTGALTSSGNFFFRRKLFCPKKRRFRQVFQVI